MYNKLTNFNRPRGHEFISFGRGFHKNHKYAFSFFYTCIRVEQNILENFLGIFGPALTIFPRSKSLNFYQRSVDLSVLLEGFMKIINMHLFYSHMGKSRGENFRFFFSYLALPMRPLGGKIINFTIVISSYAKDASN